MTSDMNYHPLTYLLTTYYLPPTPLCLLLTAYLLLLGMTSDMEEAVAAGSNSVRLGSSVFGAREWPVGAQ